MTNKEQLDELLLNKTTPEVARDLLGMYLEYVTTNWYRWWLHR